MASLTKVARCFISAQGKVARLPRRGCRKFPTQVQGQRQRSNLSSWRETLIKCPYSTSSSLTSSSCNSSLLWEPELDDEPEVPEYPPLNIRMRSYDYVLLESYHRYVSKLTKTLDLEITSWPVPARTTHIQTYKQNSSVIESEYNLAEYERTVQVENLPTTLAPILFETLHRHLPQGVWLTVKEPDEQEEEFRYVPDLMVQELEAQMADLDKAREDRRK